MEPKNELRIGNYVSIDGHSFQIEAAPQIDLVKSWQDCIKLTPEILEKYKDKSGVYYSIPYKKRFRYLYLKVSDDGIFYYVINGVEKRELYFVHNLQNLFYSLTGEELVLKHFKKPIP
jgi:hypothetical protein